MSVDLAACVAYLGAVADKYTVVDGDETTWPDIDDALAAETAAQTTKVAYPVDVNGDPVAAPDLDNALKRRVMRNLALRPLPFALIDNGEFGPQRAPTWDAEIRRLEGPYRRRVIG